MHIIKLFFLLLFFLPTSFLLGQIIDTSTVLFSDKILFDFGKYELTSESDSTINVLIIQLSPLKKYEIKITAHTDAIGSNKNNMMLAQNRANAVRNLLIQKGISTEIINTYFFGEEQPESDNGTELGRQINRRVIISVFQKMKLVTLKGQVKDKETGEKIIADIVIRTKEKKDSLQTDSLGKFKAILPIGTIASIDIFAKGYFFETQMFKVKSGANINLSFQLKKAKVGEKVDIKNLYFLGNRAVIIKRSLPELPKLLKFMQLNDSIRIEIAGHINRPNYPLVDKLSWDFKLSVKRAKTIYDYLLTNNIPPERISYKGYGNSQMPYPKAHSEKEYALNRRVEIRIVEKGGAEGEGQ